MRKPIDYSCLDHLGHGVTAPQSHQMPRQLAKPQSQYAPGLGKSQYGSIGNVSQGSAGPAPTSKPPTPPQNRFPGGTLNRSKEYRTPPVVAPPQLPSNYAPNYPRGSRGQYGTLPHPQVGMVQPQPQDGGSTMPRLSSNSMRSTVSGASGSSNTPPLQDHYGQYGLSRKTSSSSGEAGSMTRPAQAPPSPPLPTPPQALYRQHSEGAVYGSRAQPDPQLYMSKGQIEATYGTRQMRPPASEAAVYSTRAQMEATYSSRAQMAQMAQIAQMAQMDPAHGNRGQPLPGQESVYSTRPQMAEQTYQRSISNVSNPESVYTTRGQMADQTYKRYQSNDYGQQYMINLFLQVGQSDIKPTKTGWWCRAKSPAAQWRRRRRIFQTVLDTVPAQLGAQELPGQSVGHIRLQCGQGGRADLPGGSDHLRPEEER